VSALLGIQVILMSGAGTAQSPSAPGNPHIVAKPPAPGLPPIGGGYIDPTFGTRIVRVTDATTAPAGVALSSAAQDTMFNCDGTRFYLYHRGLGAFVYTLDRARGIATKLGALPAWVSWDGAAWDPQNPNRLYVALVSTQHREVWQLDLTAAPWTVRESRLFTFLDVPPGGYPSSRVQVSPNGRYVAVVASTTGGQDAFDHIVVWDRQTRATRVANTLGRAPILAPLHSMTMDTSGEYLIVEGVPWGASWVYHHPTDTFSRTLTVQEGFGGHKAPGFKEIVHPGTQGGQWMRRSLDDVEDVREILMYPRRDDRPNYYEDSHSSRILADRSYIQSRYVADFPWKAHFQGYSYRIFQLRGFLATGAMLGVPEEMRYRGTPVGRVGHIPVAPNQWWYDAASDVLYVWLPGGDDPRDASISIFDWRPLMEEIVQVFFDGARWTWRRLAHHRSHVDGTFASTPRANVDPTGAFVLFTSNWDYTLFAADGRSRVDAFLLVVPAGAGNQTPVVDKAAPRVTVTAPRKGQQIGLNTAQTIEAVASDDVGVSAVEFYVNTPASTARVCSAAHPPYTCSWVPTTRQTYVIYARAYDASGKARTSQRIPVIAR
jgi:hypothetical protein